MDLNVHNSEYKENVLVYVAGFIQRKIIEHEKCNDCSSYLRSSDIVLTSSLIEQKDLGGLVKPSVEVYQLVRTADQMIEHFAMMCDLHKTKNSYQKILTKCLQYIFDTKSAIFNEICSDPGHKSRMIRKIIVKYLNTRLGQMCRLRNMKENSNTRNIHKKMIIFNHE